MARGRMLNKKISNSKRVNDLPVEAALLYTWLIAHLDVNGCFYGDAQVIRSLVFPRRLSVGTNQVEKWLLLMENAFNSAGTPLIFRYLVGQERLLWMPGFRGEQVNLRVDKEKPEFKTPGQFPIFDGKIPEIGRKNDGVREEKRIIREVEENMDGKIPENNDYSFGEIFKSFEENIGQLTPAISDRLKLLTSEYSRDWIKDAIEKATLLEKRNLGYVEGILRGWKRDGKNNGQKPKVTAKRNDGW